MTWLDDPTTFMSPEAKRIYAGWQKYLGEADALFRELAAKKPSERTAEEGQAYRKLAEIRADLSSKIAELQSLVDPIRKIVDAQKK